MARYELNKEFNGIEIYFDAKPSEDILNKLRGTFRWHNTKKCWFAKQNEQTVALAKELCGGEIAEASVKEKTMAPVAKMPKCIMNERCCYASVFSEFKSISEEEFIKKMKSAFSEEYALALGSEQIHAWKDCFKVMQELNLDPSVGIIFEYALPYESGRRPDVILLSEDKVLILEFKMKNGILEADVDQAAAYARDIREYHFESRNREVIPYLVLTRASGINETRIEVTCVSADNLADVIDIEAAVPCNIGQWMNSKYEPLPTIVESARNFMEHAELPNIRRVNSTCIPQTLESLKKLTKYAKENNKHTIAFVTGVPGAGKTYLGLQFVYDIREADGVVNSVYLSGNGPLVKVLTDALKSNVFVKDLHKVENEYLRNGSPDFCNNVIVFDEGQRAWDIEQMRSKNRGDLSEPDVMVKLAEDCLDWCVLLILVGEGQEIYKGENSGIKQWNDALDAGTHEWEVVYPSKLEEIFETQDTVPGIDYSVFDLTVSLRSHLAGDVSTFVNHIIDGNIAEASKLATGIYDAGYSMYYTRQLQTAKNYCMERYAGCESKRFGMLASSKAYDLRGYGCGAMFRPDVAGWFNADPDSPKSSCALKVAISEFDCQGLEIDFPIIGWGKDLDWDGRQWKPNAEEGTDDYDYRINSYRVLLTRGRDGFIVFVPPGADNIANVLNNAGIKEL